MKKTFWILWVLLAVLPATVSANESEVKEDSHGGKKEESKTPRAVAPSSSQEGEPYTVNLYFESKTVDKVAITGKDSPLLEHIPTYNLNKMANLAQGIRNKSFEDVMASGTSDKYIREVLCEKVEIACQENYTNKDLMNIIRTLKGESTQIEFQVIYNDFGLEKRVYLGAKVTMPDGSWGLYKQHAFGGPDPGNDVHNVLHALVFKLFPEVENARQAEFKKQTEERRNSAVERLFPSPTSQ